MSGLLKGIFVQGTGSTDKRPVSETRYHAFISYSHALDARLALALRQGLHRFARRLTQLRALRVFRDTAALSANPALWTSISAALAQSEFLILMASQEAARSEWVAKEIAFWCENKSVDRILIVLTDGNIAWDADAGDFDWVQTNALPPVLRSLFGEEPRWLDMRWARTAHDVSLGNSRFRDAIADLAAPLHGLSKDELVGEDVRQYHRTRLITRSVVATLALLVVTLALLAYWAILQRDHASTQRDQAQISQSRFLAKLSGELLDAGDTNRAILLALEALPRQVEAPDRPYVPEAEAALYKAVTEPRTPRMSVALEGHEKGRDSVVQAAFQFGRHAHRNSLKGQDCPYLGCGHW